MVTVSEKDLVFSHGGTPLMSTICLVTYERLTEVEDMLVSLCLDRKVFPVC